MSITSVGSGVQRVVPGQIPGEDPVAAAARTGNANFAKRLSATETLHVEEAQREAAAQALRTQDAPVQKGPDDASRVARGISGRLAIERAQADLKEPTVGLTPKSAVEAQAQLRRMQVSSALFQEQVKASQPSAGFDTTA